MANAAPHVTHISDVLHIRRLPFQQRYIGAAPSWQVASMPHQHCILCVTPQQCGVPESCCSGSAAALTHLSPSPGPGFDPGTLQVQE